METLQIPLSAEESISLMRSYVYVDKLYDKAHICEMTPYFAPGFVLGVCAQIPFLYEMVEPYISDVYYGILNEVSASDLHYKEMKENEYINDHLALHPYNSVDWNFILASLLIAIVRCVYKDDEDCFLDSYYNCSKKLGHMVDMEPIILVFPSDFYFIMKSTLENTPELMYRLIFSIVRIDDVNHTDTWSLIKRFVSMQIENYQLMTFFAIADWYGTRKKTLAHADSEIRKEMKIYQQSLNEMKAIVNGQYNLGAFRLLNPDSTLPYLRQFATSAYCAVQWKKDTDPKWARRDYQDRFGVDTDTFDQLLKIPIKFTAKRPLTDNEFEEIAAKKIKYPS